MSMYSLRPDIHGAKSGLIILNTASTREVGISAARPPVASQKAQQNDDECGNIQQPEVRRYFHKSYQDFKH